MSNHDQEFDSRWEAQINALLDGELDEQSTAVLKAAAAANPELAQAIIEAHRLHASLEQLRIERAPASLRRKLKRIPRSESRRRRWLGIPRWAAVGAVAAIPLVVIAMVMMQSSGGPGRYTEAEIRQAREDLALAFSYIDRIGQRAGEHMRGELAKELRSSVTDNVARHMPFTHQSQEENNS